MEPCPCGNPSYEECCKPCHDGSAPAKTAEALMRSRYSAYVKGELDYLAKTLSPTERVTFDRKAAKDWASHSEWRGLEIRNAKGGENDQQGMVEFVAHYRQNGVDHSHHEISRFKKLNGEWVYTEGKILPTVPEGRKIFQNDPCPCGSGKKYKRCCGVKGKA